MLDFVGLSVSCANARQVQILLMAMAMRLVETVLVVVIATILPASVIVFLDSLELDANTKPLCFKLVIAEIVGNKNLHPFISFRSL
jgi:hypothetical protein